MRSSGEGGMRCFQSAGYSDVPSWTVSARQGRGVYHKISPYFFLLPNDSVYVHQG